jgi:hypothetical protein
MQGEAEKKTFEVPTIVTVPSEEEKTHKRTDSGAMELESTRPISPSMKSQSRDSNVSRSHDSGGSAGKDSSGSGKRTQIKKLRWKAWILLIVSEVILG